MPLTFDFSSSLQSQLQSSKFQLFNESDVLARSLLHLRPGPQRVEGGVLLQDRPQLGQHRLKGHRPQDRPRHAVRRHW